MFSSSSILYILKNIEIEMWFNSHYICNTIEEEVKPVA
jgi:hypothetical protein